MEADTGLAVPFFLNPQHNAVAGFFPFDRVMYEHGGGIDAPLGVVRMEYSSELHDAQVIVPHADWRGSYDRGTTIVGSCVVYSSNGTQLAPPPDSTPTSADQYGGVVGGGSYGGTKEHCIDVDWPASYTYSALQYRRGYNGPDAWMGSLIFDQRDASGLYYRRNRYYDSDKGRFTQEDPIGLAGGVNVYGFAEGDPISYSDPYGLQPDTVTPSQSHTRQTEPAATDEGSFNVVKFVVGGINLARGVASTAVAVNELSVASAGGPFAFVAGIPGAWHLATGVSNVRRGAQQLGESLHDRSGPSIRNLSGLLPFGQKFDDPIEPNAFQWTAGVVRQGVSDPVRAVGQTLRDFFVFGK